MIVVDKVFLFSNLKFHQKNFELIINILLNNDYPLKFIFNSMSQTIKYFIKNSNMMNKGNKKNVTSNKIKSFGLQSLLLTTYQINSRSY